jgi:ferric-dicitrate binding protein FerR (iron transport regulator)
VVTKKHRRSQLARERAVRQQSHRQLRERRRRRTQSAAIAVVVAIALVALALWIALHDHGSASAHADGVYYDAVPVDSIPTPNVEVTR